jgi:uncharacterized protein (DUF1330 family)
MRTQATVVLAILLGFGLGVAAIEGLSAKTTPPVYLIAEVNVTDLDGYTKEYVPLAQKSLKASGGRVVAAGQNVTPIEGTAPSNRVVIVAWDSLEQIQAWRDSAQYKEDRKIGDKYATFRMFAVEGMSQ